jgi:hypothetical protein
MRKLGTMLLGFMLAGCATASMSELTAVDQERWRRCEAEIRQDCDMEVRNGHFTTVGSCMRRTESLYAEQPTDQERRQFLIGHHCSPHHLEENDQVASISSGGENSSEP